MTCLWVGIVDGQFRVMHQRLWFNLAASRATIQQLRASAVTARDTVAARMTSVNLREAQRLAREWYAAHQVP